MRIDVDIDDYPIDVDGVSCVTLTLASRQFNVVVYVPPADLSRFAQVADRRWIDGAVRIGTCLGSGAFWSTDNGVLTLSIGHDDQTWGVAFTLPVETLSQIIDRTREGAKPSP